MSNYPITDESELPGNTMCVGELVELLSQYDRGVRVYLTAEYGNRARTEQALPIEELSLGTMCESGYSASRRAVLELLDDAGQVTYRAGQYIDETDESTSDEDLQPSPDAVQVLYLRGTK